MIKEKLGRLITTKPIALVNLSKKDEQVVGEDPHVSRSTAAGS